MDNNIVLGVVLGIVAGLIVIVPDGSARSNLGCE